MNLKLAPTNTLKRMISAFCNQKFIKKNRLQISFLFCFVSSLLVLLKQNKE